MSLAETRFAQSGLMSGAFDAGFRVGNDHHLANDRGELLGFGELAPLGIFLSLVNVAEFVLHNATPSTE